MQSGNCIHCHMPRRRTEDAVHVVMTDHLIQRRRPARNLLAPLAERLESDANAYRGPVVLYYPPSMPDGADKDLYLAVAQVSQKSNLEQGIRDLTAAVERHRPDRIEFYVQLGDALNGSSQVDEARPYYEEAARRDPTSLIALQRLGFASRSVDVLKRALGVDPTDAASWHQLGLAYLEQGARTDALSAFQRAIELDPDLSEAQNSLGGFWLESGNSRLAENAFREAIRIRPDYAEAHSNLANVLGSTNRFTEAIYHFERAIRFRPNFAAARFNYGVALARMNRYADAQRQIETALKIDPNFTQARDALRVLRSR